MTDKPLNGLRPTHPGEILREDVLPALDIAKTRFAALLRVSRQTLYDLLGEKQPVTPQMALRLGRLLGNGPDIWLRMQGLTTWRRRLRRWRGSWRRSRGWRRLEGGRTVSREGAKALRCRVRDERG